MRDFNYSIFNRRVKDDPDITSVRYLTATTVRDRVEVEITANRANLRPRLLDSMIANCIVAFAWRITGSRMGRRPMRGDQYRRIYVMEPASSTRSAKAANPEDIRQYEDMMRRKGWRPHRDTGVWDLLGDYYGAYQIAAKIERDGYVHKWSVYDPDRDVEVFFRRSQVPSPAEAIAELRRQSSRRSVRSARGAKAAAKVVWSARGQGVVAVVSETRGPRGEPYLVELVDSESGAILGRWYGTDLFTAKQIARSKARRGANVRAIAGGDDRKQAAQQHAEEIFKRHGWQFRYMARFGANWEAMSKRVNLPGGGWIMLHLRVDEGGLITPDSAYAMGVDAEGMRMSTRGRIRPASPRALARLLKPERGASPRYGYD